MKKAKILEKKVKKEQSQWKELRFERKKLNERAKSMKRAKIIGKKSEQKSKVNG